MTKRRNLEWQVHADRTDDIVDEIFIGDWFHLEAMRKRSYWMVVGGVVLEVRLRKDGRVKTVSVHGPGNFADPTKGVRYWLNWSGE